MDGEHAFGVGGKGFSAALDRQNGDVYVADGDGAGSNRRIAVMDKNGKFLRQWLPENMDAVHCMTIANDGDVYVCNRRRSKIHVYVMILVA